MRLVGTRVDLRLATPADAGFLHALRTEPEVRRFLNATGDAAAQEDWLRRYQERERTLGERYFVVEDKTGAPQGAIRLHDVGPEGFWWGSWAVRRDAPRGLGAEALLRVYEHGFRTLGLPRARFQTLLANSPRHFAFHARTGARRLADDADGHANFELPAADFEACRDAAFGPYLRD